jgi:RNA polymerase sporulation-specific sigma factor
MQGKVEISGVSTASLKVLKNSEMTQLLHQIKAGDQQARQKMIEGNLRLVLSVIQRFAGRGECMDDLFQIGCIGLIKAIDHFDADLYDVRFSTYGVPMIAGEVRRFLRDSSSVRVSRSMRDTAYKVLKVREEFVRSQMREPTVEEIARQLELRREDVVFALDAISDPVSLYDPVYSDAGETVCVMDQVRDERNNDERWLEHIALRDAIEQLSDREKTILRLRYFQGRTQMEVSGEIGISQAQVSRLEKHALSRIRDQL